MKNKIGQIKWDLSSDNLKEASDRIVVCTMMLTRLKKLQT
jgi:hypothetical protein